MKKVYVALGALLLAVTGFALAQTQKVTKDADLGLSKTSVFSDPTPEPFDYNDAFPGTGKVLPRAYPGAPPQVPHNIEAFQPVTSANNACLGCHDKPNTIGKKEAKTLPPIPLSHYSQVKAKGGKPERKLSGARFVCTQCHVPQAKVEPLVGNNF